MLLNGADINAVNSKNNTFLDYDGYEYQESYSTWDKKDGAQEILDEIDFYINKYDNKFSRKLKANRKNFKVVKLFIVSKPI